MSNYNRIAWVYDRLARLVFASSIQKANQTYIDSIPSGSRVLILGGGTGELLEHFKSNVTVTFLDSSNRMIQRARERNCDIQNIEFVHLPFEQFESQIKYDIIVCPFFLDLFVEDELKLNLTKILSILHDKGHLLVSDFNRPAKPYKWIKTALISFTILFFKLFTGLKTKRLLDIPSILAQGQLKPLAQKNYHFGMIFSSKWIKTQH